MGSLVLGYFLLCLIFFVIAVAVLRWAFRINKIVSELENIRKALTVAYDLTPIIEGKKQYPGHPEGCRCRDCRKLEKKEITESKPLKR